MRAVEQLRAVVLRLEHEGAPPADATDLYALSRRLHAWADRAILVAWLRPPQSPTASNAAPARDAFEAVPTPPPASSDLEE